MGTMRERSPGSWELTVSAGVDPSTGRYARVIRTVQASTKREAKAALRRARGRGRERSRRLGRPDGRRAARPVAGPPGGPRPLPLDALQLPQLHRPGAGPGDRPVRLSKLTAGHLDRLYSVAAPTGTGPGDDPPDPRHHAGSIAPGRAVGSRARNVASLASAPSQPQREQHPPSADEVATLIGAAEALEPMFGLYVRVVAATGMRRGGGVRAAVERRRPRRRQLIGAAQPPRAAGLGRATNRPRPGRSEP